MAAADFCAHDSELPPSRPAFRASPTHGYASQISPNKDVNFHCTSSSCTLESVGNGFVVHRQLASGSLWACMTFLFVASQFWRLNAADDDFLSALPMHIRRLPPHGRSPFRSCPRLVLVWSVYIWYTVLRSIPVFVQGTYTP